eukprot:281556-Chlamydomonas_euryale.AAC.1
MQAQQPQQQQQQAQQHQQQPQQQEQRDSPSTPRAPPSQAASAALLRGEVECGGVLTVEGGSQMLAMVAALAWLLHLRDAARCGWCLKGEMIALEGGKGGEGGGAGMVCGCCTSTTLLGA